MKLWKWLKHLWEEFMIGYRRGKLKRAIRAYGQAVSEKDRR